MGAVCGSAQICGSHKNKSINTIPKAPNMHNTNTTSSGSIPVNTPAFFEHDTRKYKINKAPTPTNKSNKINKSNKSNKSLYKTLESPPQHNDKSEKDENINSSNKPHITNDHNSSNITVTPSPPTKAINGKGSRGSKRNVGEFAVPQLSGSRKTAKYYEQLQGDDEDDNDNEENNSVIIKDDCDDDDNAGKQNDKDNEDGHLTPKQTDSFAQNVPTRQHAGSQSIMMAAEMALMEDSMDVDHRPTRDRDNSGGYQGLLTPLQTPTHHQNITNTASPFTVAVSSNSLHKNTKNKPIQQTHSNNGDSPRYPLDFSDKPDHKRQQQQTHSEHTKTQSMPSKPSHDTFIRHRNNKEYGARRSAHGGSMQLGPMSNFETTHHHSQSRSSYNNAVHPMNLHPSQYHIDQNANINVDKIYATREPNLSMSHQHESYLSAIAPQAPFPRLSSTSSDFTHLLQSHNDFGGSGVLSRSNQDSDFINWRFSQSFNAQSSSNIAIDRTNSNKNRDEPMEPSESI